MFELKLLSREGIPGALERAVRYRLLGQPGGAESIYLDVLRKLDGGWKLVASQLAKPVAENVHDEGTVVKQKPLCAAAPFAMCRAQAARPTVGGPRARCAEGASENLESSASRSGIGTCRWNVRMTRFPSDLTPER